MKSPSYTQYRDSRLLMKGILWRILLQFDKSENKDEGQ